MVAGTRARKGFIAGVCLIVTLAIGLLSASPAYANGWGIDISDGSGRVTATLTFTGSTSFKLTDVTLYDVNCDGRSAMFEAWDDYGAMKVHENGGGCGSTLHWNELDGDSGGAGRISFVQLHVYACSSGGGCSSGRYSDAYYNPYR